MKELSARAKHNAWVREQRKLGLLPYQDGTYFKRKKYIRKAKVLVTPVRTIINNYKRQNAEAQRQRELNWKKEAEAQYKKIELSETGSILNNKYLFYNEILR